MYDHSPAFQRWVQHGSPANPEETADLTAASQPIAVWTAGPMLSFPCFLAELHYFSLFLVRIFLLH